MRVAGGRGGRAVRAQHAAAHAARAPLSCACATRETLRITSTPRLSTTRVLIQNRFKIMRLTFYK